MQNSFKMMSIHSEGSLYDEQGVGSFHKSNGLSYSNHKSSNQKLVFSDRLLTPDIGLSTPDVTSLLTGVESSLITSQAPTPNTGRFLSGRGEVTTEQEMYARGFLEALDELHGGGRVQPEAMPPSDMKQVTTSSTSVSSSGSNSRMQHTSGALSRSAVHHSSQELIASSSHFMSGPNPSLEAVAPTYVTATMDYIPNIAPPSHSEPTSVYASTNSFAPNSYTPQVINHFTPTIMDYNGYTAQPVSGVHSHSSVIGGQLPSQMMKELQRVVPADSKTQEQMKVERKKARNRIAASKCRLRRLQRESDLQGKVKVLKDHKEELNNEVTRLKTQISSLKKALIHHMKGGCQVNLPDGYPLRADSSSSE